MLGQPVFFTFVSSIYFSTYSAALIYYQLSTVLSCKKKTTERIGPNLDYLHPTEKQWLLYQLNQSPHFHSKSYSFSFIFEPSRKWPQWRILSAEPQAQTSPVCEMWREQEKSLSHFSGQNEGWNTWSCILFAAGYLPPTDPHGSPQQCLGTATHTTSLCCHPSHPAPYVALKIIIIHTRNWKE